MSRWWKISCTDVLCYLISAGCMQMRRTSRRRRRRVRPREGREQLTHSGGAYDEEVATSRADDNQCQQSTRFYSSWGRWPSGWCQGGGGRTLLFHIWMVLVASSALCSTFQALIYIQGRVFKRLWPLFPLMIIPIKFNWEIFTVLIIFITWTFKFAVVVDSFSNFMLGALFDLFHESMDWNSFFLCPVRCVIISGGLRFLVLGNIWFIWYFSPFFWWFSVVFGVFFFVSWRHSWGGIYIQHNEVKPTIFRPVWS